MRDGRRILPNLVLVVEAFGALVLASLLIAVFSFRRIAALAGQGGGDRPTATPVLAGDLDWVLSAWVRRVPWRAVCFQQGLAAQLMLRRRGLSASLYYGARRDDAGALVAHVWVRSGEVDVIGCADSETYGVLAVFPVRD